MRALRFCPWIGRFAADACEPHHHFLSRASFSKAPRQIVARMTTEFPVPADIAVPQGWSLDARQDGRHGTVLRYERPIDGRKGHHWIMASGATHDEAVSEACNRMRLFDEASRKT